MSDAAPAARPLCLAPPERIAAPKRPLPTGACDCHAHVIGDRAAYPLVDDRGYEPAEASLSAYRRMLDRLGMARGVLVTPSVYGTDNSLLCDCLASDPARLRGVAVIADDIDDVELERLHGLGVRGFRVNLRTPGGVDLAVVPKLAARVAPLGWHLQLFIDLGDLPAVRPAVAGLPLPVVIDHMGGAAADLGCDGPGFRDLLALMAGQDVWVKLSGAYRLTDAGAPYEAVRPLAEALLAAAPERLVWGSDWPHVALYDAMPDTGDLLNALLDWCGDGALVERVLVANPARLYGF